MGSGRQRRERSGVKRRGRRATFPDIDADTPLDGINLATITETHDPRRFRVLLQDGGERLVDLTSWPHPSFTIAMAPLVQEHIRQLGPAPVGRSIYCKVLDLRQFWRFLDAAGVRIDGLDGMTADLIDSYENWLRHNGKSEQHLRRVLSHLISLMRLAVEMYPGRFPPDMEHRLSWLGSGEFIHSRPSYPRRTRSIQTFDAFATSGTPTTSFWGLSAAGPRPKRSRPPSRASSRASLSSERPR